MVDENQLRVTLTYIRVVNIAMFYPWELFVPYSGIFRYWLRLVNGAVIPTSDPCTSQVVSKHLVIVSSSESENREPGQLRSAAVEMQDVEVNLQLSGGPKLLSGLIPTVQCSDATVANAWQL